MKALLFVLLFAVPASAQTADPHTSLFRASMVAAVVAHSMDLAETQRCLGAGSCREVNPWLGRFDSPSGFAVAKMSIVAAQLWLVAKLHEGKPKTAIVINVATTALFAGIAAHNARVSR